MYQMNLSAEMIEDEIKEVRKQNKALEDRRDELLNEIEGKH